MASMITRADKITAMNQPSQYQAQQKKYSDFTANFDVHPDTGDLFRITDINAVKSSLKNLMRTNFYERPFQPRVGTNIPALLFENMSAATLASLSDTITSTINKYEPRVNIINLNCVANTDAESISINLTFSVINIPDQHSISIPISRVR